MPPPLWGLPAAQILDVRALGFECQLTNLPQREYFVQSWAMLIKLVQIMAQLLLKLPNGGADPGGLRRRAVRQQTRMIFSQRRSFGIKSG